MEPKKETAERRPLLSNLLIHVGREQTNLGQLGGALLDMSSAVITGAGSTKEVDSLRRRWSIQTQNESNPTGDLDIDVEEFQRDIQQIAGLTEPYDSHVFYVPGGSGIVRVLISIDEEGNPKASLIDYGSLEKVKNNFEGLY